MTKKISRLYLGGFQSHQDTEIEFSPHLNVITGSGHSGKSAILRAIHHMCRNSMRGAWWVNRSMSECTIQMDVSSGDVLERVTIPKEANRSLVKSDIYSVNGTPYTKFGVGELPPDIARATPVHPLMDAGGSVDLNFRAQSDSLFLLQDSASIRAKILSKSLCEVDKLNELQATVTEEGKAWEGQVTTHQAALGEVVSALQLNESKLTHLRNTPTLLEQAQELKLQSDSLDKVDEVLQDYIFAVAEIAEIESLLLLLQPTPSLGLRLSQLNEEHTRHAAVSSAVDELTQIEYQISKLSDTLHIGPQIQTLRQGLDSVEQLRSLFKEVQNTLIQYQSSEVELQSMSTQLSQIEVQQASLTQQIEALLLTISDCPACGQSLDFSHRHQLYENL